MKKITLLLLVFCFSFSSCEKDDICDAKTPTTPRLVIEFSDINNPNVKKSVTNLKVIGEGMTDGIIFNPNATGDSKYLFNGNKISLPLKTNATTTTFNFILNSGNSNPIFINTDVLKFNYTTNEVYVSRACGFKTLFVMDIQKPFEHTDGTVIDQKWMKVVSLQKTNINDEKETHLAIYF
ncbi:hypothetical protein BXU11_08410 [Flavobacterium sp. LM5]|uniref:DUF6452 family protein n=1 Tax=Flavobacterium sp. LM5 TaxID=1938610 RepID=UPI000991B18E|nr:DUF6452 family protein [Flavobacterium sp. LM5]OOV29869.1 hypothetical protein BXU11_08410 [Flavobacterium sp. LM5]